MSSIITAYLYSVVYPYPEKQYIHTFMTSLIHNTSDGIPLCPSFPKHYVTVAYAVTGFTGVFLGNGEPCKWTVTPDHGGYRVNSSALEVYDFQPNYNSTCVTCQLDDQKDLYYIFKVIVDNSGT